MDKEEFTRIVDQYYDDVKRIAFAGCKNIYDAEDIAQTVFLKLSQYKGIFENDEHAKKWLIRVAVNEYKSLWHSPWKTKIEYNVPELASKSPGKNTVSPHNDVLDAVMSLKRKNREVIYLFYYEEYSAKEISELLGISEATVYKRLQRAREQIKAHLRGKEEYISDTTTVKTDCKPLN